jgi:hypothetical protein
MLIIIIIVTIPQVITGIAGYDFRIRCHGVGQILSYHKLQTNQSPVVQNIAASFWYGGITF